MENEIQINIIKQSVIQGESGYINDRTAITVDPNETISDLTKRCLLGHKGSPTDGVLEIRLCLTS